MSTTTTTTSPWRALARAGRLARGERRRFALSTLLAAGAVAASAGLLTTSGYLISRAAQRPAILELTVAIVSVRAFGLARAALRYAERVVSHDLAFRILADVRLRFYRRLAPLVPGDLGRLRSGDLLSRFVADVDSLQHLYLRAVAPPAVAAIVVLGAGLTGWLMLPVAGLVVAAGLLTAATLVPLVTAAVASRSARRQAPARARLSTELVEVLDGAPELALAGRGPQYLARVADADARLALLATRDATAAGAATGLGALLTGATMLAVLLVGIPAVGSGALPAVLLAALAFLVLGAFEGVTPLPEAARQLRRTAEAAARIEEIADREPTVVDPAAPVALPQTGTLDVDGVTVRFGDREVLRDARLTLACGRRVALVGPSGAGKTTLAQLLARLRDPDAGSIRIGGVDIRRAAQHDVRAQVLLAAQDARVFTTTIRENLRLARPGADDAALEDALRRAGLADWVAGLSDGLSTFVGEDGALMSGGQRQRLLLARALLSPARFLVFDEPTAHLDPPTARRFLEDLVAATADRGVLVITHDRASLDRFDEVLRLEDGLLARDAT